MLQRTTEHRARVRMGVGYRATGGRVVDVRETCEHDGRSSVSLIQDGVVLGAKSVERLLLDLAFGAVRIPAH